MSEQVDLSSPRLRTRPTAPQVGIPAVAAAIPALAVISRGSIASAQTFAPTVCATCPTMTDVAFTYQVGGGSNVWELPSNDPASKSNEYINNLFQYVTCSETRTS